MADWCVGPAHGVAPSIMHRKARVLELSHVKAGVENVVNLN
jgi:hypothetical protein